MHVDRVVISSPGIVIAGRSPGGDLIEIKIGSGPDADKAIVTIGDRVIDAHVVRGNDQSVKLNLIDGILSKINGHTIYGGSIIVNIDYFDCYCQMNGGPNIPLLHTSATTAEPDGQA